MIIKIASHRSSSTRNQDKKIERSLPTIPSSGKTVDESKIHYEKVVKDMDPIESRVVTLSSYDGPLKTENISGSNGSGIEGGLFRKDKNRTSSKRTWKKGIAWTEEEHRLFLEGMMKYGRGAWRIISQLLVPSRTPKQVASHAQKYFTRSKSSANEKKRTSINDITYTDKTLGTSDIPPPFKIRMRRGTQKEMNSSQALACDSIDISSFVPPTIVQSSNDMEFVAPTDAVLSQMDIDNDFMAFCSSLPDITGLP